MLVKLNSRLSLGYHSDEWFFGILAKWDLTAAGDYLFEKEERTQIRSEVFHFEIFGGFRI